MLAIGLGTGSVVWITCCYESVRRTVAEWSAEYIGTGHVRVESPLGKFATIPQRLVKVIEKVPGVQRVTPRLVQRLHGEALKRAEAEADSVSARRWDNSTPELDFYGVDPVRERANASTSPISAGRSLNDDDEFACLVDAFFAEEQGVGVGDVLLAWGGGQPEPFELKIVGLTQRRRIGSFQKGRVLLAMEVLQRINVRQALLTSIGVTLEDPSRENIRSVGGRVMAAVRRTGGGAIVRSAAARLRQVKQAQQQQQFVLVLLSCVAMLTALFIILSTLSMGMIERIGQLGLLRCVGMTRAQLAALMLLDVAPLGILGVALGVPIGLGLTGLSVLLAPDYIGQFTVSANGILLACAAGLGTTLAAAALPALAATSVSPLEASRVSARPPRRIWVVAAFGVALLALGFQYLQIHRLENAPQWLAGILDRMRVERTPQFIQNATFSIVLLYLAYALAGPLLVWVVGSPAVAVVATAVRVRRRLLQDQVGHAVWRSAGICCGLMVGLSLIVGLFVFSESFRGGWAFPKQFPEAFVWNVAPLRADAAAVVGRVEGVKNFTTAGAINVIVIERPLFMEKAVKSVTWFIGCDPSTFFGMVKLEFMEGDEKAARKLLLKGGYVIIADDFSRSRNVHLDDVFNVFFDNRTRQFRVAGVVRSPALDIAAGYFQVLTTYNVVASGSVIGTQADLRRYARARGPNVVMLNFDLPPEPVPVGWPPPKGSPEAVGLDEACYEARIPLESRWQQHRERGLLDQVRRRLDAPLAHIGTTRRLKDEIDAQLTRMTHLLSTVPGVALLVAAIGVANLMTASVASRAKQLAILRAVGATRGLILRLIIGEALVLGVLGSAMGLVLGLHLALNTGVMVDRMWGFQVGLQMPWGYLAGAITLTVGLCIAAGAAPARHAARTNVMDALHVA